MPGCAVRGCSNSSVKKFKMCSFPQNPRQRAIWVKNMGQEDWTPTKHAVICEVHFDSTMWEKTRVDGTRKLKFNAIPTIFGNCKKISSKVKKPSDAQVKVPQKNIEVDSETKSSNDTPSKNVILPSNQALIKIIPQSDSAKSTIPIIFPAAALQVTQSINPIILNSEGKIVNLSSASTISGASILKPVFKTNNTVTSSMTISTNSGILKSQSLLNAANSQTPIVIPAIKSQPVLLPLPVSISKPVDMNSQEKSVVATEDAVVQDSIPPNQCEDALNPESTMDTNNSLDETTLNNSSAKSTSSLKSTSIILNKTEAKKVEDERFDKMDKLLLKQLRLNNALRKKLNLMNSKMHQLMKEQNNDHKGFLKDVFTEDQIRALELRHTNPKSITAWSHKTMMKALKLKEECGTRGYEELLKQNMPLPSIRTISRWCSSRNIPIP